MDRGLAGLSRMDEGNQLRETSVKAIFQHLSVIIKGRDFDERLENSVAWITRHINILCMLMFIYAGNYTGRRITRDIRLAILKRESMQKEFGEHTIPQEDARKQIQDIL